MVLRKRDLVLQGARRGFTLMEILVVATIIMILAGLGGIYLFGQVGESRKKAARIQVKILTEAAEMYRNDHLDAWPPSLDALLTPDQSGKGPYLKSRDALIDPWGQPYQYNAAGTNNNNTQPDIWSNGPDNVPIGNWSSIGR